VPQLTLNNFTIIYKKYELSHEANIIFDIRSTFEKIP